MKHPIALTAFVGGVLLAAGSNAVPKAATPNSDCRLVVQAIEATNRLKPGMLRAEVEKDFREDGGLFFRETGRYTFRTCGYIKIDVEFSLEGGKGTPTPSPNDRIKKVSRPYLEYPFRD